MIMHPIWRVRAAAFVGVILLTFQPGNGAGPSTFPTTSPASRPARPPPRPPPPPFAGSDLPIPPRQHEPWSPPNPVRRPANPTARPTDPGALTEELITATSALFEQGLADPRGCEYWEVGIAVGSVWGGAGVVQTHAFVLPPDAIAGRTAGPSPATQPATRFAVCWNGLVYPVQSIGQRADVRADVQALVQADRQAWEARKRSDPNFPFTRSLNSESEAVSVSYTSMLPLKCCLLLRLGEANLAADFWREWTAEMAPRVNNNDTHLRDPYLLLGQEWTWATFDRSVCAHMRGDDRLALLTARQLVPAAQLVEATAEKRGFERPLPVDDRDRGKKIPYLGFLQPAPRLLADAERRVKQGNVERVLSAPAGQFPDRAARIAALVRDLEEVSARQWGQPGGVSLDADPVIEALAKEGTNAVEPLLACLESDERLTRSVRFHRDFFPDRHLIGVDEAAYAALARILGTNRFGTFTAQGYYAEPGVDRKAVAREVRTVWAKTRGGSVADRWYAALADDRATPEQWVEAAGRIVEPVDVEVKGGWVSEPRRKPGEVPAMKGETLRGKRGPSVAELMARRVDVLSEAGSAGSARTFNLHKACDVALCLGAWDRAAAGPLLLKQIARCRDYPRDNAWERGSWTIQILGRYIARMTVAAARGGSAEALAAYAEWVRTVTPESVADYGGDTLEPIWRFADDPKIAAAAEWLFNDPASPWHSLIAADAKLRHGRPLEMLGTPLVGVPAVRTALLRGLKDTAQIGTATPDPKGSLDIRIESGSSIGIMMRYADDPLAPKRGTAVPFRACDLLAWRLSELDGTPMCELYWPADKRDQAVAALAAFLERWGDRFAFNEQQRAQWEWPHDAQARMTFPRLDHPATEADAKAGRAIFSLGDAQHGHVRLWPMPRVPLKGKWTMLKDFPRERQTFDPTTGKSGLQLDYEQVGLIWQAEEVLEGGHWRRYYGWAGHYRVAKVPAEEIEILPDGYRD